EDEEHAHFLVRNRKKRQQRDGSVYGGAAADTVLHRHRHDSQTGDGGSDKGRGREDAAHQQDDKRQSAEYAAQSDAARRCFAAHLSSLFRSCTKRPCTSTWRTYRSTSK